MVKRLRKTDGEDLEAYAKAKTNWEKIEAINEKFPYALNPSHVKKQNASYLRDIHPNGWKPVSKKGKKK